MDNKSKRELEWIENGDISTAVGVANFDYHIELQEVSSSSKNRDYEYLLFISNLTIQSCDYLNEAKAIAQSHHEKIWDLVHIAKLGRRGIIWHEGDKAYPEPSNALKEIEHVLEKYGELH